MSTVTAPRTNVRRVLLHLLTESPNTPVTRDEVSVELGREVSRQALSQAAARLARDMAIDSVPGRNGGYVFLLPVEGREHRCLTCSRMSRYGECRRLRRRVSRLSGCGGWRG
jgi:hypothetical protein